MADEHGAINEFSGGTLTTTGYSKAWLAMREPLEDAMKENMKKVGMN